MPGMQLAEGADGAGEHLLAGCVGRGVREPPELAVDFLAQQAMREHSLHICMLGICCARLPRQASGTAATARGGGWSHARQQGRGARGPCWQRGARHA